MMKHPRKRPVMCKGLPCQDVVMYKADMKINMRLCDIRKFLNKLCNFHINDTYKLFQTTNVDISRHETAQKLEINIYCKSVWRNALTMVIYFLW